MLEAALWGFLAASSLMLGGAISVVVRVPPRVVAAILGFGAGVLISAVAFQLTEEAVKQGGRDAFVAGLALGAVTFWAGKRLMERKTGSLREHRRRAAEAASGEDGGGSASAIVLGASLDAVPESLAIGAGVALSGAPGLALIAAVFLSNLPEAIGASSGMRAGGRTGAHVLGIWLLLAVASGACAGLGYLALADAGGWISGSVQAFAGGAVLAMVADTMLPDAYLSGGDEIGLATVVGFAASYLMG